MICKGCNGRKKTALGGMLIDCRVCHGAGHVKNDVVVLPDDLPIDKRTKQYRELKKKEG